MSLQDIGECILSAIGDAKEAKGRAEEALSDLASELATLDGEMENLVQVRDAIQTVIDERPDTFDEDNPDLYDLSRRLEELESTLGEIMG